MVSGVVREETFAPEWGADWPERITLGEAADEMEFDLFEGDDENLVLVKSTVPVAEHVRFSVAGLADNDTEDRTGRLEDGLYSGGSAVPPVVVLPGEGLRDGNHRVALAHEVGRAHVPAYIPATS